MATDPRADFTRLYVMLVAALAATRENLPSAVARSGELAETVAGRLDRPVAWDDVLVQRAQSVIVLLDHVGAREQASRLLTACAQTAAGDPVAQARFGSVALLLRTRHGRQDATYQVPVVVGALTGGFGALLSANVVLSDRYTSQHGDDLTVDLRQLVSGDGAIAHFALASLAFDRAVYSARLRDARTALSRMAQLAESIMTELGEDHPYLGLVLLTLSAAKCGLAAVDGNVQDLRRYADVLAIAVQRTSAQLGADHPQTVGGLANLAHSQFEIALASRSPREVAQCLHNLTWLEEHSRRVCGADHPTVVILAMNAAVAELESARQERSVERIQRAEHRLRRVARRAEERFGLYHPCTAIARSNAAAAGFDVARAARSRPGLEHMVNVLEDAVSQVSNSLGAGHATARALTQQLRACHRLLASDNPLTDDQGGGGTGTIVRTVEDEMWGIDDDYVPVYEASPPEGRRRRRRQVAINDVGTGEDFLAAIDETIKYFNDGDIVEGTITHVGEDEVLVDIGYRTEGVIPARELSIRSDVAPADVVQVGDEVEALVLRKEDKQGRLILSKKRAQYERAWDRIEALKESDEPVKGTVIEVVKSGLILDIGLPALLPASLVEMRRVRDLEPYVGRELEAKIIELDKDRDNVVLSRRAWLEQTQSEVRREFLNQLQRGQIRKGVVSSIVNFGVFVDLGGVDGLVHVSELSWKHIVHPSEVVELGQEVTVEVRDVDMERERVSLSVKATQEDPWRRFARTHVIGQIVPGIVTKLVPFGAFVRVDEGIEGLVHISELAERHVEVPEQVVQVGNDVMVKVIDIDLERRRISLSLKQANEISPDTEFDPSQYGMAAEYDDEGNYIYPEGFDPDTQEWLDGFERQREEWERRYTVANALYDWHMNQVRAAAAARAREHEPTEDAAEERPR